ncbi:hypothetical protein CIB84_011763 [Bambusicola thoracicus]|uniref:Chemokine interleukin-8-like domain-containing protein n=1 Tax=Bambusicola thoracicus TaxID=9083 RepID=A0A2P4SK46_BAMTH|nr:hypothetical protein CIB84_011763 [Bambusicola thoracicus]
MGRLQACRVAPTKWSPFCPTARARCPWSNLRNTCALPPPVHAGNNVLDCCLRTSEKPIPWRIVQDYRMQLVQDGCDIPATVFITAKGKRLCAPPQAPWVLRLREKLDTSSARKVGAGPCSVRVLGNGNSVGMGWICTQTGCPSPSGADESHSKWHWEQSRDPCFWGLATCTSMGKVWDEVCGCFASPLLAQRGGECQSLETVMVRLCP